MHYAYLLESATGQHHFVGSTTDLQRRLSDHNHGRQSFTASHAPWNLITYIAFSDPHQASQFERALKSGSGHAFAHKHLWGETH